MKTFKSNNFLKLALLGFFLTSSTAHAFNLTVLGGVNSPGISFDAVSSGTQHTSSSNTKEFAAGAMLQFGMVPMLLDFETGVQLVPRHMSIDYTAIGGGVVDSKYSNIMIPVLARVTLLPVLSLGAGPYFMTGTGQVTNTQADGSVTSTDFGASSGVNQTEFGLEFNARLSFPLAPLVSAVVDGRYNMGLNDRSSTPLTVANMKATDLLIQGGVSFGF